MNAVEFVKKFGWGHAKYVLRSSADVPVLHGELKRLVESHELVMEHGNLERAREYAESPYTAPEIKDVLLKAIEMVGMVNESN